MAFRDENEPWRFETRTPQEMNQDDPAHQAEHLEFAHKAAEKIGELAELVENAPCPGTAKTLLEQINQVSVIGLLTVHQKEQAWAERYRSELEASQQGLPAPPRNTVPDVFKDIFKEFPGLAEGGAA
jgi:hypothetical protein